MNRYLKNVAVRRVLAMVLLASAWEVLSRMGVINPFYAPAPSEILRVVFSLFIEGTIYNHLEATFVAALVGLVIGLALGIFLGFAAALVPLVADVLEPIMMLLERDSPGHSRAAVRHLARYRNLIEDRARGCARRSFNIFRRL